MAAGLAFTKSWSELVKPRWHIDDESSSSIELIQGTMKIHDTWNEVPVATNSIDRLVMVWLIASAASTIYSQIVELIDTFVLF